MPDTINEIRGADASRDGLAGLTGRVPVDLDVSSRSSDAGCGIAREQPATQLAPVVQAAGANFQGWPDVEIDAVVEARKQGATYAQCAALVNKMFGRQRSADGIGHLLKTLPKRGREKVKGLNLNRAYAAKEALNEFHEQRRAQMQRRSCLSCRAEFHSWGSGNRICGGCKNSETHRGNREWP